VATKSALSQALRSYCFFDPSRIPSAMEACRDAPRGLLLAALTPTARYQDSTRGATVRTSIEEDQMRTTRFLIGGAFVLGFGLGWAMNVSHGGVQAQVPYRPFMMQRVYTGTDGLSHVENIEMNARSVMEKITGARVNVSQPGNFSDYHVGPERRYIINLTAGGQLQVAEGKVDLPAGSIEYIDDLTGKGHTTANVGKEPRVSIWLQFTDQKQIIGPIGKAK
jgi:hypothetical protein